ncbi:D-alanyl-D-alanine carboxypeptidase/D-alanyl-D-alanine-endopeptidase [Evansella clarkii]|uniref:D-alanyl-D-alanine carboxypeptidase/D-alanyl-D-alanine endopeptidase n=1 Tax=Evansella clarkii TaxID=79879 RepID=UPI000B43832F|nr:D-alanyl-D-alanine carboxypeptidase/D-alanyl-D-alanine-endopeptidase [Evansella clarkii]
MNILKHKLAFSWLIAVIVLAAAGATQIVSTADTDPGQLAEQQLSEDILDILGDEALKHALASVHVRTESGEEIFSYNGDTSVVPASGQKLLIGAAALDTLGPDYKFSTGVYTDGHQAGKVLHGNLYIKGYGDPTMLPEDYEKMASEIAAQGIKVIQGDLVADDTFFDDMRLSLDLSWFNQRRVTGAQVSALTVSPDEDYDAGSVIVEVYPGENQGDTTTVEVYPETDYITILNDVVTVEEGGSRAVDWGREHGNNNIFVSGTMPLDGPRWRNWIAVWEPTELAQDLFYQALKDNGVKVQGDLSLGETPENAEELIVRESIPLSELFIPFMKLSNNSIAEILAKTMGQEVYSEGSWDAGLTVVDEYLENAGLNTSAIQLRDGSGMSHLNKIPTKEMTRLLEYVKGEEWFDVFYDSLPVAGASDRMEGGTLRSRMGGTSADGNVHAKTGTVTSKTSLSGYATTKDDEEMIFSIIFNNYIGSHPKNLEDEIAVLLADFTYDMED